MIWPFLFLPSAMFDETGHRLRPALLLDRDGVINVEKGYVYRVQDFEFVEGIFDLCLHAVREGMAIVIVTNQAGIGRGYYTEEQFWHLTRWMCDRFLEKGIMIDGVYFCPLHPEFGVGDYRGDSFDRKPNPGMILRARDELGLDVGKSILIGDKYSDIEAGLAAGVGCTVLLSVGRNNVRSEQAKQPHLQVGSLGEARHLLWDLSLMPEIKRE